MPWNRENLADYDDGLAPEWLVELKAKQLAQIKELRRERRRFGSEVFERHVAKTLIGAGPWPLVAFLDGWLFVAESELVSHAHMGRGGGPLAGFGARWAIAQLQRAGYVITGAARRVREKSGRRNAKGQILYRCNTTDERLIHRSSQMI